LRRHRCHFRRRGCHLRPGKAEGAEF
jgi:hypothetical protein